MVIPLVDLTAAYRDVAEEVNAKLLGMMEQGQFIGGPEVAAFEDEFAEYCETAHCVGVSSGTTALTLILKAMGIGAGDEVIVPAFTFAATAEAPLLVGARPVFVDVRHDTLSLDPEKLAAAIGPCTRAVIPVHLHGQPADMGPILEVTRLLGLRVIEDAAQAHGALYRGRRTGGLADAAVFSFFPGKNLGAFGDAGAVVTGDGTLAERVRMLRNHGRTDKHVHRIVGENGRLDAIQAAVLRIKMRRLDERNAARRRIASLYLERLADVDGGLTLPTVVEDRQSAWNQFVVRHPKRDALMAVLQEKDIACGLHYPVPLHHHEAFRSTGRKAGPLRQSETAAKRVLSLPLFPEMTEAQVDCVAETITTFLREPDSLP